MEKAIVFKKSMRANYFFNDLNMSEAAKTFTTVDNEKTTTPSCKVVSKLPLMNRSRYKAPERRITT